MIQIVAWAGAIFALIGGIGMLLTKAAPEKRARTRLLGIALLAVAAFNVLMVTYVY